MTPGGAARVVAVSCLLACGQDAIGVRGTGTVDYGRGGLDAATGAFVEAGRTPQAFATLAAEVLRLRPQMDETVAADAERKLLVLALAPAQAVIAAPAAARAAQLATTVWPFGLSTALVARAPDGRFDDHAQALRPSPEETPGSYLARLCGGPLAIVCKHSVPEFHAELVEAAAIRRYTERVRNAVAACYACTSDPAWAEAVAGWEALDRVSTAAAARAERAGRPDRWPVAGSAAADVAVGLSLTLDEDGTLTLADVALPSPTSWSALATRASGDAVAIHAAPTLRWDQLARLGADAARGGVDLRLDARSPSYPYPLRRYRIPQAVPGVRASDPLQVVLRAIDRQDGAVSERDVAPAAPPP